MVPKGAWAICDWTSLAKSLRPDLFVFNCINFKLYISYQSKTKILKNTKNTKIKIIVVAGNHY